MKLGAYTLDLYCDNKAGHPRYPYIDDDCHRRFPVQYFEELGSRCRANARRAGWKLGSERKGTPDLCPSCSGKVRKITEARKDSPMTVQVNSFTGESDANDVPEEIFFFECPDLTSAVLEFVVTGFWSNDIYPPPIKEVSGYTFKGCFVMTTNVGETFSYALIPQIDLATVRFNSTTEFPLVSAVVTGTTASLQVQNGYSSPQDGTYKWAISGTITFQEDA